MTGYTNDTFVGFDATANGTNVSLSASNGRVLLASLSLYAPSNLVNVNEQYTISVVGGANTYFDQFLVPGSAVPYTSLPGTATITGAATVPEPASIVSGLIGMVVVVCILGVAHAGQDVSEGV
jgi:hypothetical protein